MFCKQEGFPMFAEKIDAALAAQAPRPFPNLRARETIKAIVEGIVETVNHVRMTEAEQTAFALGYVRGAVTVLRQECEDEADVPYSALPHVLEILDAFNQRGIAAVRIIAERVAGQELQAAEHAAYVAGMLPDLSAAAE